MKAQERKAVQFAREVTGIDSWNLKSITKNRAVLTYDGDEEASRPSVFRRMRKSRREWGGKHSEHTTRNARHDLVLTSDEGREVKLMWSPKRAKMVLRQRRHH